MEEEEEDWNEAVAMEVELVKSVYGDDVSPPSAIKDDDGRGLVELTILCRPRTGGRSTLAFIQASLVIRLDVVSDHVT